MSSQTKKTYDTDVITLRRVLTASDANNLPISSGYILTTFENGTAFFTDPLSISSINAISTVVGGVPIGISTLSTLIGTNIPGSEIIPGLCTMSSLVFPGFSTLSTAIGGIQVINTFITISSVSSVYLTGITSISSATNVYLTLPTLSTNLLSAGTVVTSSLNFVDLTTQTLQLLVVSSGILKLNGSTIVGDLQADQLFSTVAGLGTAGYVSTSQLLSTSAGIFTAAQSYLNRGQLTSTVTGLGTAGFISSLPGIVSTANLRGLVSSANLAGLISTANLAGLVSTANLSGLVSSANLLGHVSTANLAGLVSTANLSGLVSSANLVGLVSTANLAGHVSTANLVGLVSSANLAGLVSTTYLTSQLQSTIIGLGTAGYLSTTLSTTVYDTLRVKGLSTTNLSAAVLTVSTIIATSLWAQSTNTTALSTSVVTASLVSANTIVGTQVYGDGNNLTNLNAANLTGYLPTGTFGVNTIPIAALSQFGNWTITSGSINVGGTVQGWTGQFSNINLYDSGYGTYQDLTISSGSWYQSSTQLTIGPGSLLSTVAGLGTAGYISSLSSFSLSTGTLTTSTIEFIDSHTGYTALLAVSSGVLTLNGAGIVGGGGGGAVGQIVAGTGISISPAGGTGIVTINATGGTTNLVGIVSTANLSGLVSSANLVGLVSTANLSGLVSTANLAGLVSTANLVGLLSTVNLSGLVSTANLTDLVSTSYLTSKLASTVRGLGTAGYVSSLSSFLSLTATVSSLTTSFVRGNQGYISSLVVDSLQLGSNSAFVTIGDAIANSLSTLQINVGTVFGTSNQTSIVSVQQLYVSSIIGVNLSYNLGGVVSTANLRGLVSSANLAGLVSTANLAELVSTPYFLTQLTSTVGGLGTAGYLSTTLSTTFYDMLRVNGLSTVFLSSGAITVSSLVATTVIAQSTNTNALSTGIVTARLVSAATLVGDGYGLTNLNAENLTGTIPTANFGTGSVPTSALSQFGDWTLTSGNINIGGTVQGWTGQFSNLNLYDYGYGAYKNITVSSGYWFESTTQITIRPLDLISTVRGLGTAGYISSLSSFKLSTGTLTTSSIEFIDSHTGYKALLVVSSGIMTLNGAGLVGGGGGAVSQLVAGTGISLSPAGGTGVVTINATGGAANLVDLVSTANLADLVSTANLADLVSTANLADLVSTANLADLVSTANLADLVSTANLADLISTSFLDSQLASTVEGLGTAGYVSTSQLLSTTIGIYETIANNPGSVSADNLVSTVEGLGTAGYVSSFSSFLSLSATVSTLTTSYITGQEGYISSLVVDSLQLGSNSAFVTIGDAIANSLSTLQINVGTVYGTSNQTSIVSVQQLYVSSIIGVSFSGGGVIDVGGLVSTAYFESRLVSTVGGLGTAGYLSTTLSTIVYDMLRVTGLSTIILSTGSVNANLVVAKSTNTTTLSTGFINAGHVSSAIFAGDGYNLLNLNTEHLTGTIQPANFGSASVPISALSQFGDWSITAGSINVGGKVQGWTGQFSNLNLYDSGYGAYTNLTISSGAWFQSSTQLTVGSRDLVSTVTGLGTAGYVSTSQLLSTSAGLAKNTGITQTQLTSSINNLLIPYSTLNISSYFQLKASSTQLYFGGYGSTSQIYIGDILAAKGNTTTTHPLLLLEQLPIPPVIFSPTTVTYTTPTENTTWQVPANVTSISIILKGAGGGAGSGSTGGEGGYVSGILPVTPGTVYTLIVGRGGSQTQAISALGGGGKGGNASSGGGGRSALKLGGIDIVTAGGGGGGGAGPYGIPTGGSGGGSTADSGVSINGATGGGGAHDANGGSGGYATATSGVSGSLGQGGSSLMAPMGGGAGGGGGWYGGGQGGYDGSASSGGGGGNSLTSNLTTIISNTVGGGGAAGYYSPGGNGFISITYTPVLGPSYRPGNLIEVRNYQLNKFIVDPLLNIGINVSSITSGYQLDVGGTTRTVGLSTQQLFISSINGQTIAAPFTSTVAGLGTAGYVSTSQLLSTTTGIYQTLTNNPGYVTGGNLTSTVAGLGTARYLSSFSSFLSLRATISTLSTSYLTSQRGYISSLSVDSLKVSTVYGTSNQTSIVSVQQLYVSSIIGVSVGGAVINVGGLVSTAYFESRLVSTVGGLGTAGYLSSPQSYTYSTGLLVTSSINFFDGNPDDGLNYMTVSSGKLLLNGVYVMGGDGGTGVSQIIGATNIQVSPGSGTGAVTISLPSTFVTLQNLTSSVTGLGTAGYISTLSNVDYVSTNQNVASSFSGNLADAFTLITFDL